MSRDKNYFEYKDSRIWYTDKGSGEIILLVHGFAASSYTWRYLEEHFAGKYRVISLDLIGFGHSAKPVDGSYSAEEQAEMLAAFIAKKNLNKVTLVGHSFGGAVVLATYISASMETRKSIEKLILIDSAAYKQELPNFISILRVPLINRLMLSFLPATINSRSVLRESFYDESKISDEMINTYASFLKEPGAKRALIKTASNIVPHKIEQLTAEYKKISIPVLIVWGEEDTVVKKTIGIRLHQDIAGSQFEAISRCGHIPQEECPKQLITIMEDYLPKGKIP